jgi:uncharacterized protein YjbJ (UPF0337 family)
MDENRVTGAARNFAGRVEAGVGDVTGDTTTQLKGKINQATGAAQNFYGQTADAARDTASSLDDWFRDAIETRPYTVALAALGIGWLLGRTRQPY